MTTQQKTKVTDQDRVDSLPETKAAIRRNDPNLSESEIERRALTSVGLSTGDDPGNDVPRGGRGRRGARAVTSRSKGIITSSGARKAIFGVMLLSLMVGIARDVGSGAAFLTDVIPRRIIGVLLASIFLMAIAGPAPGVARGLAFLIGFTIAAFNSETIAAVTNAASSEQQPVPSLLPEQSGSLQPSGPR